MKFQGFRKKLSIYFRHSQTGSTKGVDVGCRWEWKILIQTEGIRNSHKNTRHINSAKLKRCWAGILGQFRSSFCFSTEKRDFSIILIVYCVREGYTSRREEREREECREYHVLFRFSPFYAVVLYVMYTLYTIFSVRVSCCCWRVPFLLTRTRR